MKKFGEGQQPFYAIVDIPEGDAQELTTVTDQLLNSLYGEFFNLLKAHGINPTTTTSADLKQVARAVWSAVSAGNLYKDTGSSNVKNLTHIKAAGFLFKNTNANDDGFTIEFLNKTENTGAVTVNVFDVENNVNHFNNIPLVAQNGNEIQAKTLAANSLVKAYFSKEINKFVLLAVQNTKTTDDNVYNIDGIALRDVALQSVDSVADIANITKTHGRKIYVASYHAGLNKGGGIFIYDATKSSINDGGVNINGWVRQLNSNEIDPVCFGAKANFTSPNNAANAFDDAPAVQKTVNYLASIGGGVVVFGSGKYWINSYQRAETSDPINVIDMKSDVSFKWENGSQFIIGNYFDDKPFHIFSGLIKDAPVMRNIHFINPYITSIIENNYLKTRYARRVIVEFRQCENVSVTGGIIRDVETTNVFGFGSDATTSFGATVENVKFLNVVYGGLNSANEDHTTIYLNAEDSKVTNCTFSNINGEKGWRTACPCELHASNTTFSNSKVSGYTRGGWFVAAEHEYTTNQCIENITAVIANAGIYIWCNQGTTLDTCIARNNTFICSHGSDTDTPLYYGMQGLFGGSGQDEGGTVQNMVFENNTVIFKYATKPEYQTAFHRHYQNHINFTIRDNKFIGCSAGIRGSIDGVLDNYKNWDITNNVFEVDTLADSAKDAYLLFDSKADLYQFRLDNNVFKFKTAAPKYICKLTAETSSLNYLGNCIVPFNAPTIADYTYPNNVASDYHNIIYNTFYGLTFNVPAIDVGKYVVAKPTVQPAIAIPFCSKASFIGAWQGEVSVESDVRVTTGNIKAIIKNATSDNTQSPQREVGGVICKVVGYV